MELNFQYTEADYQEFVWDYYLKSRGRWLLLMLVALVAFIALMRGDMFDSPLKLISVLVPLIILAVFWLLILRFIGKRTFRVMPHMQEMLNCQISEDAYTLSGETFSSEFKWAGVQRVTETKNLFLLYNSRVSAVMLPKRAFSIEEERAFRAMLEARPGLPVNWKS